MKKILLMLKNNFGKGLLFTHSIAKALSACKANYLKFHP